MAGLTDRFRCILPAIACLVAGALAAGCGSHFHLYPALWGALSGALAAVVALCCRLHRTRLALERALRAKSEFLANVSHELRTPLNGIEGLARSLARECGTPEAQRMATAIEASCDSLIAAVDRILDYVLIEKGGLKIEPAPFDLRAAVRAIAEDAARKAAQKGLAFEAAIEPTLPCVILGDMRRLRQVLHCLLDNAIKFTSAGEVRLEAGLGGDSPASKAILFRVRDTGSGIQPKMVNHLFAPFTQADTGSTRAHGGLGLGLTLAHRLVTLMGGSLGVESQPGRGSVFWVLLPAMVVEPECAAHAAIPSGGAALPSGEHRSGRVLVVDDNPINQLVAVRAVHNLGYTADAVAGGEAALDLLSHTPYDVVLMDCQMPGMDGFETCSAVRRREAASGASRVPIIAMTANGPGSNRDECLAAGMDDYLAKPFHIAELSRALNRWISASVAQPKAG
ncbi:MAG TPA: response regulator [Bryobacteraceae bacterium]|nr:response regulator [Bryobacteraceae bacterium]